MLVAGQADLPPHGVPEHVADGQLDVEQEEPEVRRYVNRIYQDTLTEIDALYGGKTHRSTAFSLGRRS